MSRLYDNSPPDEYDPGDQAQVTVCRCGHCASEGRISCAAAGHQCLYCQHQRKRRARR